MGMFVRSLRPWVTALTAAVVLVACGGDDAPAPLAGVHNSGGQPGQTSMLQPFASTAEFRAFTQQFGFRRTSGASDKNGALPPTNAGPTTGGAEGSAGTFSHTNVQEAGVDEPDVVKTDGEYLYIASDGRVNIVDAVPAADMRKVAELAIPGRVEKMFLDGARLVVIYHSFADPTPIALAADVAVTSNDIARTGVLVADVSDPLAPVTQRHELFDGWFTAARRVADALHVVLEFTPNVIVVGGGVVTLPGTGASSSAGGAAPDDAALSVSRRVVAGPDILPAVTTDVDPTTLLPKHYRVGANSALTDLGALVDVSQVLHPTQPRWLNFVLIVSIDLAQPGQASRAVGYLGDSAAVYAAPQALYIVQSDYSFVDLPVAGGDVVSSPPVSARAVANSSTQVHKFALQGAAVQASASGAVPGTILSQYSLSEHKGFLRVATHDWNAASAVYVLEQVEAALDIAGKIENIAPGENLYAARFLGDRGFLVTFEQIDPLFTLDLSNPRAPALVGELKVPGFSEYLHPIDATHVLAVGRSTQDVGGRIIPDAVQISLFDITDFANPQLQDAVQLPPTMTTEASYNPLAFNYWTERNLLALPVANNVMLPVPVTDPTPATGPLWGAMVFDVDLASGLLERGQLLTTRYDYPTWSRAIFIGDYTYYVRNDQVEVAATAALDNTVASVELAPPTVGGGGGGGVSKPPVAVP